MTIIAQNKLSPSMVRDLGPWVAAPGQLHPGDKVFVAIQWDNLGEVSVQNITQDALATHFMPQAGLFLEKIFGRGDTFMLGAVTETLDVAEDSALELIRDGTPVIGINRPLLVVFLLMEVLFPIRLGALAFTLNRNVRAALLVPSTAPKPGPDIDIGKIAIGVAIGGAIFLFLRRR